MALSGPNSEMGTGVRGSAAGNGPGNESHFEDIFAFKVCAR